MTKCSKRQGLPRRRIFSDDNKIVQSLDEAVGAEDFGIKEIWGEQIEDRGCQITFSALGQRAPLEHKEEWDADFSKRKKIKALLKALISEFTVRLGGTTSIDVTKLGIDKAYGIKKLREILGIELKEMLFTGDAGGGIYRRLVGMTRPCGRCSGESNGQQPWHPRWGFTP